MPRTLRHTEDALQQSVASWLIAQRPDCEWFAVPNGGARRAVTAALLKSMGVRAGVADLAFVLNGGQAAFIELKTETGRLSDAQKAFAARVDALGGLHAVCRSLAAVMDTLKRWGVKWGRMR